MKLLLKSFKDQIEIYYKISLVVLLPWLFFIFLFLLLPIDFESTSLFLTYRYVLISIILTLLGLFIPLYFYPSIQKIDKSQLYFLVSNKQIVFFNLLSFLALMSLLYDRTYVQQISYSKGIALARWYWEQKGLQRFGVSSNWSVFGNLFVFSCIPPLLFQLLNLKYYGRLSKIFNLTYNFILVISFSILNGGRGALIFFLVLLSTVVFIYFLRSKFFFSILLIKKSILYYTFALLCLSIFFSSYITSVRAQANQKSMSEYSQEIVRHLYGNSISLNKKSFLFKNEFTASLVVSSLYLTHGFSKIVNLFENNSPIRNCSYTFRSLLLIFNRIKGIELKPCSIDGFMMPLYGVFQFDYRNTAYLVTFVFALVTSFIFVFLLNDNSSRVFTTILIPVMLIIASPFFYIPTFSVFPFIVFNCIIFDLFLIKYRKKN